MILLARVTRKPANCEFRLAISRFFKSICILFQRKDIKSLSTLVISEINNTHYNPDPLINCDGKPKIGNNIIKEEEADTVELVEVNGEVTETADRTSHIYHSISDTDNTIDSISDKEELINDSKANDEIIEANAETIEANDEDLLEINQTGSKIDKTEINYKTSYVKRRNIVKRPKIDAELEEKFTKVEFSEEEIIKHRENKRNHYNFKKIPFKCDSCVLGFTKKETFDKHMEKKHDEVLYYCFFFLQT